MTAGQTIHGRLHDRLWHRTFLPLHPDPAFVVAVDAYGSMRGGKATTTFDALIILREACLRLGLPLAIIAFNREAKILQHIDTPHDPAVTSISPACSSRRVAPISRRHSAITSPGDPRLAAPARNTEGVLEPPPPLRQRRARCRRSQRLHPRDIVPMLKHGNNPTKTLRMIEGSMNGAKVHPSLLTILLNTLGLTRHNLATIQPVEEAFNADRRKDHVLRHAHHAHRGFGPNLYPLPVLDRRPSNLGLTGNSYLYIRSPFKVAGELSSPPISILSNKSSAILRMIAARSNAPPASEPSSTIASRGKWPALTLPQTSSAKESVLCHILME